MSVKYPCNKGTLKVTIGGTNNSKSGVKIQNTRIRAKFIMKKYEVAVR